MGMTKHPVSVTFQRRCKINNVS